MAHKIRSFDWHQDNLAVKDYEFPSLEHALSFYRRNRSDFFHSHHIKIYDDEGQVVHDSQQSVDTYA